jgi:DNA-binding LacI/PurR family transcriptional regulator
VILAMGTHVSLQAIVVTGDCTERGGRTAALKLLTARRRPTAIFAANDSSALGVLSAARSLGLVVPASLSVMGFDNTTIAQSEFVGLSTIDYPRQDMGEQTLALLKGRIADPGRPPAQVTLTPQLAARLTTAPPRPTRRGIRGRCWSRLSRRPSHALGSKQPP